jgi:hypothetical protein
LLNVKTLFIFDVPEIVLGLRISVFIISSFKLFLLELCNLIVEIEESSSLLFIILLLELLEK